MEKIYYIRISDLILSIYMFFVSIGMAFSKQEEFLSPFDVKKKMDGNHIRHKLSCQTYNEYSRFNEFLVDSSIVIMPAPFSQGLPSSAFDGTNYFIVWTDFRNGLSARIYGARVDSSGTVLDLGGIPISNTAGDHYYPAVAFDGTNYLVVWEELVGGADINVFGVRVSQSGIVLDSTGISISTASEDQSYPAIAFDGTNFFVVWEDHRNGSGWTDVYGARVSQAGVVLDQWGIPISMATNSQLTPSVAFDGTNYLVVWCDFRSSLQYDIYGARVSPAGTVLDPNGITISGASQNQENPVVAFDGTNYLVVWQDPRPYISTYEIYGARVTPDGSILDPNGINISTASGSNQVDPSVAFNGTDFLVAWHDDRNSGNGTDIYGARVTQSGIVRDSAGIPISSLAEDQNMASVSSDSMRFLITWMDSRDGLSELNIYSARVSDSGTVLDPAGIIVSEVVNEQQSPSVAFDSTNYLVVWADNRNDAFPDIYGARLSEDGSILDSSAIAISTMADSQICPMVTFGNTDFFAVWEDNRSVSGYWGHDIYGTRINRTGLVLDTEGIAISILATSQFEPAVSFDGTNFFVVWYDSRFSSAYDIRGARVSQSGTVLDPVGIMISNATSYQRSPMLSFGATNYFVVWEDNRSGTGYDDIYGARVSPSGTILDPAGIAITTATNSQDNPSISFDGTNYFVVWEDNRHGDGKHDIYGARVSQSGSVIDTSGIGISTSSHYKWEPSITFDRTNYLVIWQDSLSGSSTNIYGVKMNQSGVILDSFIVSVQPGNQYGSAIAHGYQDRFLTVFSGWTDIISGFNINTYRIWGKIYPFTGINDDARSSGPNTGPDMIALPNPFKTELIINIDCPGSDSSFCVKIYDAMGRSIKEYNNAVTRSPRRITWDGRDDLGEEVPAGIYFVCIMTQNHRSYKKVVFIH